jgi:hypothetical protein
MSVLSTTRVFMELTICSDTPVYPYIEPYPLPSIEPSTDNVPSKVALSDNVTATPKGLDATNECIPTHLTATMSEDPGLLCTELHQGTATVESIPLDSSATGSRLPHLIPPTSQKAACSRLPESTAEESSHCTPAVFRRFSAAHATYSIPGRELSGRSATGFRPLTGVGRSPSSVDTNDSYLPATRFSTGSIGRPLQEVSVSFSSDTLGLSGRSSEAFPNDGPPVRRRDSLVWQRARAFDDMSEFSQSCNPAHRVDTKTSTGKADLYEAPMRITLETLAKFPMPPISRAPQTVNRRKVPFT